MDDSRGFSWRAATFGAVAILVLIALGAAAITLGGFVPVAASRSDPAAMTAIVHTAMERSVKRSAAELQPPRLARADVLEGGSHFKGMCQQCHGGPGVERDDFAKGLNPRPPDLSEQGREWSRSEVFWIAKHGIRMTGMPAFGESAPDDELWKIAAFVDQLPTISAEDYAALADAHAQGEAHSH